LATPNRPFSFAILSGRSPPPWSVDELEACFVVKDSTGLGRLGVQPHIGEAVINHLPPKLIRTYDRNAYEAEKRAALDAWASHLKVAVAQATVSIVAQDRFGFGGRGMCALPGNRGITCLVKSALTRRSRAGAKN
jgi:hypothetical protein